MRHYKRSRQRERILEILQADAGHVSAEKIFKEIKPEFPRISLGTVYRNLGVLTELGFIKKLTFGSGIDRYDSRTEDHYHFLCEECREIYDLSMPVDPDLNERMNEASHHTARRHQIEFFGRCAGCAADSER